MATKSTTPEAYLVKESSEEISWRRDKSNDNKPYKEIIIDNKVDTVTKGFNFAVAKYGSKRCMGTREVLGEMDEVQENGKVFKKLSLGEYKWINYIEAQTISTQFGRSARRSDCPTFCQTVIVVSSSDSTTDCRLADCLTVLGPEISFQRTERTGGSGKLATRMVAMACGTY